jgi:uncharacterized cupredoxin-like copper-binding protein
MNRFRVRLLILVVAFAHLPRLAFAHDDAAHANASRSPISTEVHAFGVEGDPRKASRTIALSMDDRMRYSPAEIKVAQGETVTLAIRNKGKLLHELVLGTADGLARHAELMRKFPGMEHDEPFMVHVKPGTTKKLTWKFTQPGTFLFGCLVAGHFEAGMQGRIVVEARQ